jgi:hypothetical protein
MEEIGLHAHYTWYNGSGSCRYIRVEAAEKLSDVIQKHHDNGEEIASPKNSLINTLKHIAENGDSDDFVLTKTWQAASYIIAEHIYHAKTSDEERNKAYGDIERFLKNNFLPKEANIMREMIRR